MKTSKIYLTFTAIALAATVFVISCKKADTDTDTTSASDNNLAQQSSDNLTNMASQVSENSSTTFRSANPYLYATVTHDTSHQKIFVLFTSVVCSDGHTRNGKITLDWSQSTNGAKYFRDPGFKLVITDSAYSDNGSTISIHKTITNTTASGFNPASTNETWTVVDNDTITKQGGGTIVYTASLTKTLLNTNTAYHGPATAISWDSADVGITGSADITDSQGQSFPVTITSQLVRNHTCSPLSLYPAYHPLSAGAFNFTPPGKKTRYITFDGSCDNKFTVTINGIGYTLTQ